MEIIKVPQFKGPTVLSILKFAATQINMQATCQNMNIHKSQIGSGYEISLTPLFRSFTVFIKERKRETEASYYFKQSYY